MHKAQRLVQLIMLVNERRTFTVQELADECGVSRRTMIRDLAELSELGIPLYSEVGPHGGYRVLREKVLPPISFTEYEAMALFFAAQSLQNYRSLPFNNEVQSALRKFFHYLSSDLKQKIKRMQQRLTFWVPPHELDVPYLKDLLEAALEQRILQICYEASAAQERLIQPLGLYTMNGLWYCRAYCFRAVDYRVFRVDRISGLRREVDQSQKVDLTEENIQEWILRDDLETPLELKASLSPEGVRRCQSDVWLSQFLKVNEDGSGRIHAHMGTSYTPWVVSFFLGLGTDAHVTHPPQIRDQIRTKLQTMAAQYGD